MLRRTAPWRPDTAYSGVLEQYAVHRLTVADPAELVVILSGGVYLELESILVAPLYPVEAVLGLEAIHPKTDDFDAPRRVMAELTSALPRTLIGEKVGSLAHRRYDIQAALDRLMSGY